MMRSIAPQGHCTRIPGSAGRSRARRRERGQVLVLTALLLTGLLGLVGLVVDTGHYYAERRQTQNTADQAALAAARELRYGGSVAQAQTAALQNAAANGFNNNGTSNTVTVNIPPASGPHAADVNYAEVMIDQQPQTFFIHVLTSGAHVRARGVGWANPSLGGVLFATENDCSNDRTIHIEGDNIVIDGDVHSNGSLKLAGTNNTITGTATYVCSFDLDPTNNVGSGPTQVAVRPAPVSYTYTNFTSAGCLFTVSGLMIIDSSTPQYWLNNNPATGVLKSGIYCSTGGIKLAQTNVSGTVTFASQGKVELDSAGANFNLTPYWNDVLLFSSSTDLVEAIEIGGSNGTWTGILNAPNGGIKFGGPGHVSTETMAVSRRIKFDSGSTTQLAAGKFGGGAVALVE